MQLEFLPGAFSVCKLAPGQVVDTQAPYTFLAQTDGERSLVCPVPCVPEETLAREDGWCALRVVGAMEFSLVGILAGIAGVLAAEKIPIFAISTYDTDYVLLKEENRAAAKAALLAEGYTFTG